MITKYALKDKVSCPHCGENWDESADMFVIPGREGEESTSVEECYECGGMASIYRIGNEIIVDTSEWQP